MKLNFDRNLSKEQGSEGKNPETKGSHYDLPYEIYLHIFSFLPNDDPFHLLKLGLFIKF